MLYKDEYGIEKEANGKRETFIIEMEEHGIPWRWYSGRFMYGEYCPAVAVGRNRDYTYEEVIRASTVTDLKTDQLGLGDIVYTG